MEPLLLAAGPNWLGSPQHLGGGFALALAVARLLGVQAWLAVALAIGVTCTAEVVVELVEYPTMYAGHFHYSAYYDTLADMANSLVGGIAGAVAGAYADRLLRRRRA